MASPTPRVQLVDAQRLLSLFAEGIAGRYFHLKPLETREPKLRLEAVPVPSADGLSLYLPDRVEAFTERRSNLGLYKVAVMHQLGFFEFGTYDFDFDRASASIPALAAPRDAEVHSSHPTGLERFFACFERPPLMRRIFTLLEDHRIDCGLRRRYPGLARDLDRAMALALAEREPLWRIDGAGGLLEALVRCTLGADRPTLADVDGTGLLGQIVALLDRLSAPSADVYASAVAAIECLEILRAAADAALPELRGEPRVGAPEQPLPGDLEEALLPVDFRGRPELGAVQRRLRIESAEAMLETLSGVGGEATLEAVERLADDTRVELDPELRRRAEGVRVRARTDERAAPEAAVRALLDDLARRTETDRRLLVRSFGEVRRGERSFLYDEWDYHRGLYLRGWCRLFEARLEGEQGREFLESVQRRHRDLFGRVRRQFEQVKPDSYERVRRVAEGEEIDIDSAVEAHSDRRAGFGPSDRVYLRRERRRREVAAAFLVDLSSSLSGPVPEPEAESAPARVEDPDDYLYGVFDTDESGEPPRLIVDIEKEALALMVQALEALGDAYGIYGFSGSGRERVELYVAKEFDDALGLAVWDAIAAMQPRGYTRMGPAIRHTARKLLRQGESRKVLLLLSDGFPQDIDYGADRNDREYGIQDTARALQEAELAGIQTFCVTVDRAGHDYLRRMCPDHQYLVLDEVESLPAELGKVYRTLTRPR